MLELLFNIRVSNEALVFIKSLPFIDNDPVIFTEPVNVCVSDSSFPNILDPLEYNILDVIV